MGSHYFDQQPISRENRKEISFRFLGIEYSFLSDDGVFSKSSLDTGTRILLETISQQTLTGSVLDYGCGIGVIGLLVKEMFQDCEVTGFDINQRAVTLAQLNAQRLKQDVDFYESSHILENHRYDTILMNPPIRSGKQSIYQMFKDSYHHLNDSGRLFIVIRKSHGAPSAMRELQSYFREVFLINRDKGFFILECVK